MAVPVRQRLLSLMRVGTPGECWPWLAHRKKTGYGRVRIEGRLWRAHRAVMQFIAGVDVSGLVVMHSCDKPWCCNPLHLRVGSQSDNVADRVRKGRSARGSAHSRAVLTEHDVVGIRVSFDAGILDMGARAKLLGVVRSTVYNAATRKTWRHI